MLSSTYAQQKAGTHTRKSKVSDFQSSKSLSQMSATSSSREETPQGEHDARVMSLDCPWKWPPLRRKNRVSASHSIGLLALFTDKWSSTAVIDEGAIRKLVQFDLCNDFGGFTTPSFQASLICVLLKIEIDQSCRACIAQDLALE
jgi:hypothetical protein